MHYLSIFFKRFNKACVNFSRVRTKNAKCWEILRKLWKFLMKILYKNGFFYFYFVGKFVTKNRAFGNSTIFLQQFFWFRGGGEFPPFPLATPFIPYKYGLVVFSSKQRRDKYYSPRVPNHFLNFLEGKSFYFPNAFEPYGWGN